MAVNVISKTFYIVKVANDKSNQLTLQGIDYNNPIKEKRCSTHKNMKLCEKENMCQWNGKSCKFVNICKNLDSRECKKNKECAYFEETIAALGIGRGCYPFL